MSYQILKLLGLSIILSSWLLSAKAIPIFDITTSDTPLSIAPNGQTTITYSVHNNSGIDMPIMRYFPPPLTRITTGGTCNAFLAKNASCTVALLFTAPNQFGQLTLGPLGVCGRQGRPCSVPNSRNRVNVIITPTVLSTLSVASGSYTNGGITTFPLLVQTSNAGTSWTYAIDAGTIPSGFTDLTDFNSSYCTSTICIATGRYQSGVFLYPMLAQTTDQGATWSYAIDASTSLPTGFTNNGFLVSIGCGNSICVSGGGYAIGATFFPLVAQTTNNGTTWTYPVDSAGPALPGDFSTGNFTGATCRGSFCIAGGEYLNGVLTGFPLLAQTTDNGATWSYAIDSVTPVKPSDYSSQGLFLSESCGTTICIAAGIYGNVVAQVPLVAQTTNNGTSWSYVVDSGVTPGTPAFPADGGTFGAALLTSACSGNMCIAAGQYSTATKTVPLLVQTNNGGSTWTYALDSGATIPVTPPPPPDFFDLGIFQGSSCNGNLCIAVGSYTDTTLPTGIERPMIAQSTNGGVTWSYVVDSTTPTPPSDFVSGGLVAASCNANFCIATGQYSNGTDSFPLLIQSNNGGATWTYRIYSNVDPGAPTLPMGYVSGGLFSAGASMGLSKSHKIENMFMLKPEKIRQIIPLKPVK